MSDAEDKEIHAAWDKYCDTQTPWVCSNFRAGWFAHKSKSPAPEADSSADSDQNTITMPKSVEYAEKMLLVAQAYLDVNRPEAESISETPLTDAVAFGHPNLHGEMVSADDCREIERKLNRQLAQANADLANRADDLHQIRELQEYDRWQAKEDMKREGSGAATCSAKSLGECITKGLNPQQDGGGKINPMTEAEIEAWANGVQERLTGQNNPAQPPEGSD